VYYDLYDNLNQNLINYADSWLKGSSFDQLGEKGCFLIDLKSLLSFSLFQLNFGVIEVEKVKKDFLVPSHCINLAFCRLAIPPSRHKNYFNRFEKSQKCKKIKILRITPT